MREDPPRVPSSVIYVAGSKELGGSRNVHRSSKMRFDRDY